MDGFAGANIALNKPAVAGTVYTSCSGQGAPSGYCEPYFVNDGSLSTFAMTGEFDFRNASTLAGLPSSASM